MLNNKYNKDLLYFYFKLYPIEVSHLNIWVVKFPLNTASNTQNGISKETDEVVATLVVPEAKRL